jgi:hypothetical protein
MTTYINARELFGRIRLEPGRYVLLPTTFAPGEEGDFMIRIHSTAKKTAMWPLLKDAPTLRRSPLMKLLQAPPVLPGPGSGASTRYPSASSKSSLGSSLYPIGVFRAEIVQCTNLARQKLLGTGADPYCVLRLSEPHPSASSSSSIFGNGDFIEPQNNHTPNRPTRLRMSCPRTRVQKSTLNPVFESAFMWPVCRPREAWLQVEIWNRYPMPSLDRFMGCVVIRVEDYMKPERAERTWEIELALRGIGGSSGGSEAQGSIRMRVKYEGSLDFL